MKLLVRKLWFPFSVEESIDALFKIPQVGEVFNEDWAYDGEMIPRGFKLGPLYWSADKILEKMPFSETDIYLVITSTDIKRDKDYIDPKYDETVHRVHGMGKNRKALATNCSFIGGDKIKIFNPNYVDFNAIVFGEIGHALGLDHHEFDPSNPCNMSHSDRPRAEWTHLEDIRFCSNCYQKIR